jgi:hypothetical protein
MREAALCEGIRARRGAKKGVIDVDMAFVAAVYRPIYRCAGKTRIIYRVPDLRCLTIRGRD